MEVTRRGGDEEREVISCSVHTVRVTRPYLAVRIRAADKYVDDLYIRWKGKGIIKIYAGVKYNLHSLERR
jgi:hypothetical protein